MSITRIRPAARMSQVVIHNNTAYLCGQVPEDTSQGMVEQTRSMLEKVDALLTEVGSDRNHLLSATIYVKDMSLFAEMNEVWDNWVPSGHAPARTCVQAPMANPDYLVEVSVVAAIPAG
ncbi:RidA family protein [Marinobacter sp. X15-166B]|uniref:RidA family protein n=1 Tax=Marinobacter sp. X15-166B TaxID=1897620 RepID=UPI00085C962B|nr:RidA family protein [Marinobacter sp. X15-166B]OEY67612.1 hypothetical protein BG841_15010 [Marinobacter sp. X15-166B]